MSETNLISKKCNAINKFPNDIIIKLDKIKQILKDKSAIIALSGGVDSAVLAWLSTCFARKTIAITISSELSSSEEIQNAKLIADFIGLNHKILTINRLDNKEFNKNDEKRCYYCKKVTFKMLKNFALENEIDLVIEGSNVSDLGDYRPGLQALNEEKIISPFLESEITKGEIRIIAKEIKLPNSEKASNACLVTRIPYNENLSMEKLEKVEFAESYLHSRFKLKELRVRIHNAKLARIEVDRKDFNTIIENSTEIINTLKQKGLIFVALDLKGFRSGSMNEILEEYKEECD